MGTANSPIDGVPGVAKSTKPKETLMMNADFS
jgi:hypothetical protein